MGKRNWLVEDNLVALYIELHGYKDLDYELNYIETIIPHKGFSMRIRNYKAIDTEGREGLDAALESLLWNELFDLFKDFSREKFTRLVNAILDTKVKIQGA